ncbi:MAG: MATE family efflux transporter [Sulfolobales archaeon]|nr:MATE family efflux transporter [Sulfolobales archaeon]MCX8198901.1 MATE family efflux transporter [Sulfolobales archaeon]MDW8170820.1 MATE family efflux transporter [Desulfurococcaceae archaeon]
MKPSREVVEKYRDRILNGSVVTTMLRLGAPLMAVQALYVSYNIADAYWLSVYSQYDIAVPRQVWPIQMLFLVFAQGIAAANLALISQYVGAGNYERASEIASKFLTVNIITSIAAFAVYTVLVSAIYSYLVNVPQLIYEGVVLYAKIMAVDLVITCFNIVFTTVLQAMGDTVRPSIIGGVASIVNIILDPFMILGIPPFPKMGIAGAALATVLSKLAGTLVLMYLLKNYPGVRLRLTKKIDLEWLISNFKIGLPVMLFMASNSLAFTMQTRLINVFGEVTAAAYSIGFIVMDVADAALWGLSSAVSIMIGQNLGAGKVSRAREVASKSMYTILAATSASSIIIYPIRGLLIDPFTDDPSIYAEASIFIDTFLFSLPFFALFFIALSVGRGSGHTSAPTAIGVVRLWILRVGLGYYLALLLGLGSYGVWLAMAVSNYVGGAFSIIWVKYGRWAKSVINVSQS